MTDFFELDPKRQAERLETASRAALGHWSMSDAELHLIKYRENAVFRVEHNGIRRALRLHRYGYHSDAELRSELQWIRALAEYGIAVPAIVPADSGEIFVSHYADDLPGALQIDMFEWVDGRQLGSVEEGIGTAAGIAEIYATIGQLAGRLHNQAASWRLPAEFTRHAWDADGLAGGEPLWGQFWKLSAASRSEKRLLTQARDRVHRDLERLCRTPDDYSMIHADFAPENLLVDGNAICLIDFDDAGFGWHLFELATSLFFIRREPFFEVAQEALLKGYREHRTLPDDQLDLLPLFFLARGLTYVGWVHTRPETETAHELTPMLLEEACTLAEQYLST